MQKPRRDTYELPSVPSAQDGPVMRPLSRSMCSMRCEALGVCQALEECRQVSSRSDSVPPRRAKSSRDIGLSERDAAMRQLCKEVQ